MPDYFTKSPETNESACQKCWYVKTMHSTLWFGQNNKKFNTLGVRTQEFSHGWYTMLFSVEYKKQMQIIKNSHIYVHNIGSYLHSISALSCGFYLCQPGHKWFNWFFQILWKSRRHILVTFPSHLKKLRSILRFRLEKLNCGFFHSFHSWKNTTK